MQQIVIVVRPGGQTQVQAQGLHGRSCLEATRFLEATLGKVESDRKTPDFYATESTGEQQHVKH